MKLQRTTLVLLLLAILLGGFVYFYEFQWKSQQEAVKKKQQQLFSFKEDDVKNLKITTPSETITLERSPESSKTKWLMKSPENVPANDGTVAYLLDLLEKEESKQTVNTSASKLTEFGLTQPQATIDITLNNQKTHKLTLGKQSIDNNLIYAQNQFSTKPDGNVEVLLVSKNFENAIKRSLLEWKVVENQEPNPSPSPQITPNNLTTPLSNPTIKAIPVNPTPKTIPNSSTATPTPASTTKPTATPTPASTTKPTPTTEPTPKPINTLTPTK